VIRVVVADDQELVREGFAAILSADPGIEVVGLACDGVEAVRATREHRPHVVVMDVRMPRLDGIAATAQVMRLPEPASVLILTTFDLDEYVFEALRNGAAGFLLKDAPPGRLAEAIRTVAAGDTLVDPAVTRRLVERFVQRGPRADIDALTRREREVLVEIARGRSNSEIAERLVVSEATVKTHVAAILRKHGLRDRAQAVVLAYESGLVEPGTG
jgi:DNA-binding NarL/FixJ family response regulator